MAINTLLVNAGRRVELLAMLRSASAGRVVAVDIDPLAPALYHADVAECVPPVSDPSFVQRLLELCATHAVGLVVPTTDRELGVLSARREDFLGVGAVVAIGSSDAVLGALDKLSCSATLTKAGVAAVPTSLWLECESPPFAFPVIVKPRRGAAADGVRVIAEASQWTPPPSAGEWLVQPLVGGPEVTLDVLAAEDGRVVCLGARERLKVRGGEVERARTVPAEPFLATASGLARALGLSGPFNFQVMSDQALVGEVNPRVGGGLPLSEQAGAALLESLCRWAGSREWPSGDPRLARAGVYMTRHDASTFLDAGELAW